MRRSVRGTPALVAGLVFVIMFLVGPNSGRTEQWANSALEGGNVKTLAIDPVNPTTVYPGAFGGVFKSTDAGATWFSISTGLSHTNIRSLAADPVTPDRLYAGAYGGIMKSKDGGAHWSLINGGLTHTDVKKVAVDPVNPATLYAGAYGGGHEKRERRERLACGQ
jgi:hypothetical protein